MQLIEFLDFNPISIFTCDYITREVIRCKLITISPPTYNHLVPRFSLPEDAIKLFLEVCQLVSGLWKFVNLEQLNSKKQKHEYGSFRRNNL